MATRSEWNRLIDLTHTLALVENDLREAAGNSEYYDARTVAERILFERF